MVKREENTIVTVKRLPMTMVIVKSNCCIQTVVGGRLVSERSAEAVTAHRDLPPYTPSMFPGGIAAVEAWGTKSLPEGVTVYILKNWKLKPVSAARACSLLFNPRDAECVRAFIIKQGGKYALRA